MQGRARFDEAAAAFAAESRLPAGPRYRPTECFNEAAANTDYAAESLSEHITKGEGHTIGRVDRRTISPPLGADDEDEDDGRGDRMDDHHDDDDAGDDQGDIGRRDGAEAHGYTLRRGMT